MRDLVLLARFLVLFVLILAIDALAGERRNPLTELQTGKHSSLAKEALDRLQRDQEAEIVLRLEGSRQPRSGLASAAPPLWVGPAEDPHEDP